MSSMFERDFIKRMAKQLAAMVAALLELKDRGDYTAALTAISGGYPDLLGIDQRTLAIIDSATAAQLLGDPAKVAVHARLVREEAELWERLGDPFKARVELRRSLGGIL